MGLMKNIILEKSFNMYFQILTNSIIKNVDYAKQLEKEINEARESDKDVAPLLVKMYDLWHETDQEFSEWNKIDSVQKSPSEIRKQIIEAQRDIFNAYGRTAFGFANENIICQLHFSEELEKEISEAKNLVSGYGTKRDALNSKEYYRALAKSCVVSFIEYKFRNTIINQHYGEDACVSAEYPFVMNMMKEELNNLAIIADNLYKSKFVGNEAFVKEKDKLQVIYGKALSFDSDLTITKRPTDSDNYFTYNLIYQTDDVDMNVEIEENKMGTFYKFSSSKGRDEEISHFISKILEEMKQDERGKEFLAFYEETLMDDLKFLLDATPDENFAYFMQNVDYYIADLDNHITQLEELQSQEKTDCFENNVENKNTDDDGVR